MGRIQGHLLDRSYQLALRVLALVDDLPNNQKGWVVARQLVRSGTGVGANLREANHAFTRLDFAHRCSVALREAAETECWLSLSRDAGLIKPDRAESAFTMIGELIRILSTVVKKSQTAREGP